MSVPGCAYSEARTVLDVSVELAYFHCGKALIRSGLWDETRWPATDGLATLGAILADQIPGVDAADAEARVAESIRDRLY